MTTTRFCQQALIVAAVAALALLCRQTAAAEGFGNCSLARQLAEDGYQRSLYMAQLAQIRAAATSRFGESASESFQTIYRGNERIEVDHLSFDCISCHDGVSASYHDFRYRGDEANRVIGIANVTGSHPIGMHYGSAAYANQGLKRVDELHEDVVLVNGRVGCLSCHNPLNPAKKHLVMSTEQSNLCFGCHAS